MPHSLDIIWLSEEKRIVEITASAPPCSSKPCPSYGINEASMYVLEIGAGEAARMGLRIGDQMRFWPAGTAVDPGSLSSDTPLRSLRCLLAAPPARLT